MDATVPLDRVFIEIGPLTIYWYGVIIAAGMALGLYLALKEAERLRLNKDIVVDFILYAVPIALISARVYYVIFEWEHYMNEPIGHMFAIWEGGIAIHGAVIGGVLTAIVFTRMKKISFWQLADLLAPSLILGQAIGRWGNFMNQEAHGGPLPIGSSLYEILPDFMITQMTIDGVTYHPTFLYESLWSILVFVLLIAVRRQNPIRGEVFLTYAIGYSIGRYFIEGMRTDSLYIFGVMRTAQLVSILLVVVSIFILIYRRRKTAVRYKAAPVPKKKSKKKKK